MVATDQDEEKQGGFAGLLALLDDEQKARLKSLGENAAGVASQPIEQQVMPTQYGGGLLQMMPTPAMQYGQGMMGFAGNGESNMEKKAAMIKAMKMMLGMGA